MRGGNLLRGAVSPVRELFWLAGTQSTIVASLHDKFTEERGTNRAIRDRPARHKRQAGNVNA